MDFAKISNYTIEIYFVLFYFGQRLYVYILSNVARLAAHQKFVWVFNADCNGTIIFNDPVQYKASIGDIFQTSRLISLFFSFSQFVQLSHQGQ
jgi:hypothetical protein